MRVDLDGDGFARKEGAKRRKNEQVMTAEEWRGVQTEGGRGGASLIEAQTVLLPPFGRPSLWKRKGSIEPKSSKVDVGEWASLRRDDEGASLRHVFDLAFEQRQTWD